MRAQRGPGRRRCSGSAGCPGWSRLAPKPLAVQAPRAAGAACGAGSAPALSGGRGGAGALAGAPLLGRGGLPALMLRRAGGEAGGEAERPAGPPPDAPAEAGPSRPVARGASQRPVSLVWLRRDLRLDDNPALTAALKTGGNVVRGAAAWRRAAAGRRGAGAPVRRAWFWGSACLRPLTRRLVPPRAGGVLHLGSRGGRPVPARPLQPLVAAQQPEGAVSLAPEARLAPGFALRTPGARPQRARSRAARGARPLGRAPPPPAAAAGPPAALRRKSD